jgi:hypothetical protein
MSGDGPHRDKHVKFTTASTDRLGKWAEDASADDLDLVSRVLLRVVDGTWQSDATTTRMSSTALPGTS